jgi:hypothetical protein
MLRITVDLHPAGVSELRRTVGTMTIANVTNLSDVSDYHINATEGPNPLTGLPAKTCVCKVCGHQRRQSVWALIAAAIAALEEAEWSES